MQETLIEFGTHGFEVIDADKWYTVVRNGKIYYHGQTKPTHIMMTDGATYSLKDGFEYKTWHRNVSVLSSDEEKDWHWLTYTDADESLMETFGPIEGQDGWVETKGCPEREYASRCQSISECVRYADIVILTASNEYKHYYMPLNIIPPHQMVYDVDRNIKDVLMHIDIILNGEIVKTIRSGMYLYGGDTLKFHKIDEI